MMSIASTDRIEKEVFIRAPRARVWLALTDVAQFSEWFGVRALKPFAAGARSTAAVTHPGYEHVTFDVTIEVMEPERRFSWRWHPHPVDPTRDYSDEPTTLVTFDLEDAPGGTRLRVVESGFDGIPLSRRLEAFRGNEQGWAAQMQNIERYVHSH